MKTRFTRRKFLKTSAFATATGLAAPRFFSSASATASFTAPL
jgi:hypothetical protein